MNECKPLLTGIDPKKAGAPMLEALCDTALGAGAAAAAMTTLAKRHPERAAAHLSAMTGRARKADADGVPGAGVAVARLFSQFPLNIQGILMARMSAPNAAALCRELGPLKAARALSAVTSTAAEGGGGGSPAFAAAAVEALQSMGGWSPDAEGVPRSEGSHST